MTTNRLTAVGPQFIAPAPGAGQRVERAKSGLYSLLLLLLLAVALAACGGENPTPTSITIGDLPSYPHVSVAATSFDPGAFPQQGQYDSVQAITFTSPDDSATIRTWYKQQLTAKGWMVVADAPSLLGLTPTDRSKLIELFISANSSGSKVIAYYASGRKPTPTP